MTPNELLKINVNDHTEKKNGLTYLSWAWAWDQVLRVDPQANYEVIQFNSPDLVMLPYQTIGNSAIVWVAVTVFGKTIRVQLPILDYRNKCIASPNAFDVNTSIMRCLTKGIAMHGLGLYIYAGEDLPMEAAVAAEEAPAPAPVIENVEDKVQALTMLLQESNSLNELTDIWRNNQVLIDSLKVSHKETWQGLVSIATSLKAQFKQE